MNYFLIYQRLIAKAKERICPEGYVEKHHILPRALGGSDDSSNLVALTSREHFVAHVLLAKIHGGVMWSALLLMKGKNKYTNARLFEIAREKAPIEREKAIAQKRSIDPSFDAYMNKVRSKATENRQEGYQKKAGEAFKIKFASDQEMAKRISENRKKANLLSVEARNKISFEKAQQVLKLRKDGLKYDDIRNTLNVSMGFISKVVNQGETYVDIS
jgi:hypothetical protein